MREYRITRAHDERPIFSPAKYRQKSSTGNKYVFLVHYFYRI